MWCRDAPGAQHPCWKQLMVLMHMENNSRRLRAGAGPSPMDQRMCLRSQLETWSLLVFWLLVGPFLTESPSRAGSDLGTSVGAAGGVLDKALEPGYAKCLGHRAWLGGRKLQLIRSI